MIKAVRTKKEKIKTRSGKSDQATAIINQIKREIFAASNAMTFADSTSHSFPYKART